MAKSRFAITAFREKLDLSQADLTALFRLERSQIAHIESGNRKLIGDALMAYTRMKLVLHQADTSKA